jgi:hypothetical protein
MIIAKKKIEKRRSKMEKNDIKGKKIESHNIAFAATSNPDYEMWRILLLENMPDTRYDEYILMEGYHCSCYGFDECDWDCTKLNRSELIKILKDTNEQLRKELKNYLISHDMWERE